MKNFDEGGDAELAKQGIKKTHTHLLELEKSI